MCCHGRTVKTGIPDVERQPGSFQSEASGAESGAVGDGRRTFRGWRKACGQRDSSGLRLDLPANFASGMISGMDIHVGESVHQGGKLVRRQRYRSIERSIASKSSAVEWSEIHHNSRRIFFVSRAV